MYGAIQYNMDIVDVDGCHHRQRCQADVSHITISRVLDNIEAKKDKIEERP